MRYHAPLWTSGFYSQCNLIIACSVHSDENSLLRSRRNFFLLQEAQTSSIRGISIAWNFNYAIEASHLVCPDLQLALTRTFWPAAVSWDWWFPITKRPHDHRSAIKSIFNDSVDCRLRSSSARQKIKFFRSLNTPVLLCDSATFCFLDRKEIFGCLFIRRASILQLSRACLLWEISYSPSQVDCDRIESE